MLFDGGDLIRDDLPFDWRANDAETRIDALANSRIRTGHQERWSVLKLCYELSGSLVATASVAIQQNETGRIEL